MKQRIAYLDNAKALLILLVALVHVLNYANPGYDIIPYILPAEFISSFIMQAFSSFPEFWRTRKSGRNEISANCC